MNKIIIRNEQNKLLLKSEYEKIIKEAINTSVKALGKKENFEVSVLIVDNEIIRELNHEYRGVDSETDVLSFPMLEFDGQEDISQQIWEQELLGDIVISLEKAEQQATLYGHNLEREIGFLTVHSMLHLFGYDHEDYEERAIMRSTEEDILSKIGLLRA